MAALNLRARLVRETVKVSAKQNDFFPKVFEWRGKRHIISAVESCRTETRRDWLGKVQRHRFRVRTAHGAFELIQDVARDTWQVECLRGD